MAFDPDAYLKQYGSDISQSKNDAFAGLLGSLSAGSQLASPYKKTQEDKRSKFITRRPIGVGEKVNILDDIKKGVMGYLGGAQIPYLSPALIGAASYTTEKGLETFSKDNWNKIKDEWTGKRKPASFAENWDREIGRLKSHYDSANQMIQSDKKASPIGSILGQIPRDVLLFELGGNALGAGSAGAEIGANASKLAKFGNATKELAKDVARNTAVGTGIAQLENPDINRLPYDIAFGAALDLGTRGTLGALRKGGEVVHNIFGNPKRNQKFIETAVPPYGSYKRGLREDELANYQIAKDAREETIRKIKDDYNAAESARKQTYDSGVYELMSQFENQEANRRIAHELEKRDSVDAFKELIRTDPRTAAENFKNILDNRSLALSKSYDEAVTPVMQRYAGVNINPSQTMSKIDEILSQYQLFDEAGKPSPKALNDLFDPEIKSTAQSLLKARNKLSKSPTLQDLNLANRQFGDIAGFGKPVKSSKEKIFGSLYHQGKDDLISGLEQVASPEELQQLLSAKQNFASQKGLLDEMQKTFAKPTDRLAVNLRSKIPGSKIKELMDKIPESKEALGDLYLNMLTQSSVAPRKFTKEIDYYGRDVLQDLLGKEKFDKLMTAEQRLHKASLPFKKSIRPTPLKYKELPMPELPPELAKPQIEPSSLAKGMAMFGDFFDPARRQTQTGQFTHIINAPAQAARFAIQDPMKDSAPMNEEEEIKSIYQRMKNQETITPEELEKLLQFLQMGNR